MTDPTVSFVPGSPVVGKPFVLVFEVDDDRARDGVVYLSEEQRQALMASGFAAGAAHRRACCVHDWVTVPSMFTDEPETRSCDLCGAVEAIEPDGTVLPVGDGL